ncbi:unnamed protein product [Adineta ricciae]|uniref:Uncharacterized protein n=1 Tax=Adineta ricciae TaxID=249248 RepID=A0A814Z5D2_ADIRI|nr:unnamed protein product [Adineta ricciae]
MEEKQPLIKISSDLSDENFNTKDNNLTDWKRLFSRQKIHHKYENFNEQTEELSKTTTKNIFHLLKYSDRLTLFCLLIGLILIIIHAFCVLANLILFGQITGIFANQLFSTECYNQHENLQTSFIREKDCPKGIELHSNHFN